jgi:predicted PurR-regulated permease PerM
MRSVETVLETEPAASDIEAAVRRHETALLIERLIGIALVGLVLTGTILVLWPFLTAFLFAAILVIATWPLHEWMLRRGIPVGLTAAILTILSIACIVAPAFALAPQLGSHLADLVQRIQSIISSGVDLPAWIVHVPLIGAKVQQLWSTILEGGVQGIVTPHMAWLRSTALTLGGALAQGIVQILLSLIIAAMFWIQGETLRNTILEIGQRFGGELAKNALQLAAASIRAVSYGILGTAVAQAMLLALGMWICGIPGAGVLGFIALIIALSQVGILLVLIWGGCAWWLYSNGETNLAIFMAIWGTIVSVIDNVLRPLLVGVAVTIPFTMIFFGVFGGFVAFGFLGMFIGPTLLAVFIALLQAWRTSAPV